MPGRALLVCYYFPPMGMGGIGRPLNLLQELPHLGWECDILTVKPVAYRGYETEILESLDQSHIYRSGSYDPQRLLYLLGTRKVGAGTIRNARSVSSRFFPDSKIGWTGPAVRFGKKLLKSNKYDVVVTTSPPISCHQVGRALSKELEIPWVADFRDYWTVEKIEQSYTKPSFVRRGHELLSQIKAKAHALVATNESIGTYVGANTVIQNAFNEELAQGWKTPESSKLFRIGILENQIEDTTCGPLLDVIEGLKLLDIGVDSRIELIQIGQVNEARLRNEIGTRSLRCKLILHGYLSRRETIQALNNTHLMYLGVPRLCEGQVIPGRVYDLLASGRPVLCSVDGPHEIEPIIEATGNGLCFDKSNIDGAVAFLRQQYVDAQEGKQHVTPRPAYSLPYGSRRQAERFVELFERLK